jgi:hypothetical protein
MFLLFGFGLIPILIFLVVSVIIVAATENDANRYATGSFVVGAGLIVWLTKSNPLPWLAANSLWIVLGILGYFVAGILWGFFKWYLFNLSVRDKIEDGRLVVADKADSIRHRSNLIILPISPREHKTRIVGWMTYWPWSTVWFVLNDPVRRAWNAIYNRLVAKLEAVSNHVFKGLAEKNGKA